MEHGEQQKLLMDGARLEKICVRDPLLQNSAFRTPCPLSEGYPQSFACQTQRPLFSGMRFPVRNPLNHGVEHVDFSGLFHFY